MTYPKWLYSANGSVIVQDKDEHDALEGTWHESPADVPADVPTVDGPVKVDGRKTRHNKEA